MEVAHVSRDSNTTFKVKGQLAGGGAYCGGLPHSLFHTVIWAWNSKDVAGVFFFVTGDSNTAFSKRTGYTQDRPARSVSFVYSQDSANQ